MSQFTWDKTYSVNNDDLDNHHKRLFVIFNNLYNSCLAKDHRVTLRSILEELDSYTHYHFEAEVQHMKSIGYKNVEKHILEHKYFTDRIHNLIHDKDLNESLVSKETVLYLWKWLMDHVLKEDQKYSIKIKKKGGQALKRENCDNKR